VRSHLAARRARNQATGHQRSARGFSRRLPELAKRLIAAQNKNKITKIISTLNISEILLPAFRPLPQFTTSTSHHRLPSGQGEAEQAKGARQHLHFCRIFHHGKPSISLNVLAKSTEK